MLWQLLYDLVYKYVVTSAAHVTNLVHVLSMT